MLILPFDGNDQRSLFIIVGASSIRSYNKIGFKENRPCIIHYNPNKSVVSRHKSNYVCDKLRTWLNIVWRAQSHESDVHLQPFNKRTMPICTPIGESIVTYHKFVLSLSCSYPTFLNNTLVHEPRRESDRGICIVHYALSICDMDKTDLLEKSYEKDGHHSLLSTMKQFSFNDDDLVQLRTGCLSLICNITHKFCTVLDDDYQDTESICCSEVSTEDLVMPRHHASGTCNIDYSSCNESQGTDNPDDCCSEQSGSVYIPDVEIEREDEGSLYDEDDRISDSAPCDDDSECDRYDVAPCATEGTTSFVVTDSDTDAENDIHTKDNLVCPGDVIEYRSSPMGLIKRNAIVTIHRNGDKAYIVMENGAVLLRKKLFIRKVKMYCGKTGDLIPNPLAEWRTMEKCLLQHGSLLPPHEQMHPDEDQLDSNEPSSPKPPMRPPKKGGKKRRLRTSEGLTNVMQHSRMRTVRREENHIDSAPDYPKFPWLEMFTDEYCNTIDAINGGYRKMLEIGKAQDAFRKAKHNVKSMINAKTKREFATATRNIDYRYKRHLDDKKDHLQNFRLTTELIPNPRKYQNRRHLKVPTRRQTIVKEQILTFEQYLSSLNILKCSVCLECHIEAKPETDDPNYKCSVCTREKDPTFFLDNNLHPVWYLVDAAGEFVTDDNGNKMVQYHIPHELACLTMSEKLLIRRCANFVPSVHLKNGVYGIKGHCIAYPQDITNMCNELPLRKETVLTFIRNIGNKDTDAIFPTSLRVNKNKVLNALHWLKKHNPFYKNITIKEENFDWMEGKEEASIATKGVDLNVTETENSKKCDEEEEYVSKSHKSGNDEKETVIDMCAVHANVKQTVPTGRQAQPIKEFIQIAKETSQSTNVMNYPPIDHDCPVR